MVCVQRTVQSETVIGVCTVHSAEWDCYWCVYSAPCRVRLLLVCVLCSVQSETVIGVCTVHSAEWDCYWCVYIAPCRVRFLLVCVQCTMQSETVIGVCTVHRAEWDCYWCVYSALCRVRLWKEWKNPGLFHPEVGGSTVLRNISDCWQTYTAKYSRRLYS